MQNLTAAAHYTMDLILEGLTEEISSVRTEREFGMIVDLTADSDDHTFRVLVNPYADGRIYLHLEVSTFEGETLTEFGDALDLSPEETAQTALALLTAYAPETRQAAARAA